MCAIHKDSVNCRRPLGALALALSLTFGGCAGTDSVADTAEGAAPVDDGQDFDGDFVDESDASPRHPLMKLDDNGDGIIQRAEFDIGQRLRFDEVDADDNGIIEGPELAKLRPNKHRGEKSKRQRTEGASLSEGKKGKRGNLFDRADANGDGIVTQEELAVTSQEKFKKADTDGDGRIPLSELSSLKKGARHADKGRDGHVPASMDANGDGAVDVSEWSAHAWARMVRADENGDGQIAREELTSMKAKGHNQLEQMDDDGVAGISREEFAAAGGQFFERLDVNASGALEADELDRPGDRIGRHAGKRSRQN